MLNDTDIIVKFSEKKLVNIIDVNKMFDLEGVYDATLKITCCNDDSVSFMEYNGFRINAQKVKFTGDTSDNEYTVHSTKSDIIYTLSFDNFEFVNTVNNVNFTIPTTVKMILTLTDNTNNNTDYQIVMSLTKDELKNVNLYKKQGHQINNDTSSFLLLRTNPKLTGNIKLVVSDDYNLYLDTFKVASDSILNNRRYRHQKISSDGNYAHDVKTVFGDLPKGELFNVHSDSYDPHKTYYDMWQELDTIYEYGAETNADSLYDEDLKILAPLHIGKTVPEFFAIFRSDEIINIDTYRNVKINDLDIFKDRMKNAKVIKIFDLRNHTSIGHYLNQYKEDIQPYINKQTYLQFAEYDSDSNIQGQNTWYGISVDKGLYTKKIETTYFGNQILDGENPQENFANFVINGFERNNLLYPNIINLEFMFNDDEVDQFSMHNYFGLYLTENDFISLNCVIKSQVNNEKLTYYDNDNSAYYKNQLDFDIVEDNDYNKLFFMTTSNKVGDMKSTDDVDDFIKTNVCNKPEKNICNISSKLLDFDDAQSFITLCFTEQIHYGEHFRFIFLNNSTYGDKENIVFEIIASNDERLKYVKNYVNPYVQTNTPEKVGIVNDNTKIYRINFYTQDIEDSTKEAPLEEQLTRLKHAIAKFDSFFYVQSVSEDTISVLTTEKNSVFQHITSTIRDVYTPTTGDYHYNSVGKDTIRPFTYNNEIDLYLLDYINKDYMDNHLPFAENGFEILGNRYTSITQFLYIDDYEDQYWYQIDKDIYQDIKNVYHPLANTVNGYFPITNISYKSGLIHIMPYKKDGSYLSYSELDTYQIDSPFDVTKSMVVIPYKAHLNNGYFNICTPVRTNLAVMGINAVKDIDTRIDYTDESTITNSPSLNIPANTKIYINSNNGIRKYILYSLNSGSIQHIPTGTNVKFMLTDDSLYYEYNNAVNRIDYTNDYIYTVKDTVISMATANYDTFSFVTKLPVFNSDNYYKDKVNKSTSELNIPIVPLVNCRWRSNGQYADNNSMLDTDYIVNTYTKNGYFIENNYNISDNKNYATLQEDDIIEGMTVRDFIITYGYRFPIKKILVNKYNLDTAICYYNEYIQTLEFIFNGIKYSITFSSAEYKDIIKLNQYNNYDVMVVNNYDDNATNEMFISTDEEFILIINHNYKLSGIGQTSDISYMMDSMLLNPSYNQFDAKYAYDLIDTAWIPETNYCFKKNTENLLGDIYAYIQLDRDVYEEGFYYTTANKWDNPVYMYFNTYTYTYNKITGKNDKMDYKFYQNSLYDKITDQEFIVLTDMNNDGNPGVVNHRTNDLFLDIYGDASIDYKSQDSYILKLASPLVNTDEFQEKLDSYISDFNTSEFNIYMLQNGSYSMINAVNGYNPIVMTMKQTNKVKYHNGFFTPNFVDIFDFDLNDEISDRTGIDLLCCNTSVSSINPIVNYTCNKVMESNKVNTYNYFTVQEKQMFNTCWDNLIYRIYSSDSSYKDIEGYTLGIADKTFFGTSCINLQYPELTISKWDYDMTNIQESTEVSDFNDNTEGKKMYVVRFNLSKVFYNMMMNNASFIDNWIGNISKADYTASVNNYINNTLLKYYNFKSNQELSLYCKYDINKKEDDSPMVYDRPDDFESEYTQITNFKSFYEVINDDVYFTVKLSDYSYNYYYPVIKIKKY